MKLFLIILLVSVLIVIALASETPRKGKKKGHELTSTSNTKRRHSKQGQTNGSDKSKLTRDMNRRQSKKNSKRAQRSLTPSVSDLTPQSKTLDPKGSVLDVDPSVLDSNDWFFASGPHGFEDLQPEDTFWPFTSYGYDGYGSYPVRRRRPVVVVKRRGWWPAGPASY